ncbi:MAG: tyrosine-type recombinase/integrase [Armatimonadetes bacterium]|nr:tyrosine-type recombinase/integrase [Armatimonadota bacterium]
MTSLSKAVKDYLALRRTLGFKMIEVGNELNDFVKFARRERASRITTDLAVRWAKRSPTASQARWATRLGIVRRFAQYMKTIDRRTEIPPRDLLRGKYRRKQPHLYKDDEILQLLAEARKMRSPTGLRAQTYYTLLALLTVTGMRLGEVLALDRRDVDLRQGVLAVRRTKCRKERLVPLHETTRRALIGYARVRDRVHPRPQTDAFLVTEDGRRLHHCSVRENFVRLSRSIGIRTRAGRFGHGPRLHDLRHRFAITTLIRWYRSGVDVECRLPVLSTYLGHTKITDTYWYLEAVPELLRLALRRIEKRGRR